MLVAMCRRCFNFYEWDLPAFRTNDSTCHSCDARHVTVGLLTPEMIDKLNEEDNAKD